MLSPSENATTWRKISQKFIMVINDILDLQDRSWEIENGIHSFRFEGEVRLKR